MLRNFVHAETRLATLYTGAMQEQVGHIEQGCTLKQLVEPAEVNRPHRTAVKAARVSLINSGSTCSLFLPRSCCCKL